MRDPAIVVQNRKLSLVVCLLLLVGVGLVFGQTRSFPFINYDDPGYVTENAYVNAGLDARSLTWAFTNMHGGNWHPLTTLSHILDCELFGLWAGGHHLVNVLLHGLAAVSLFLALQSLTGAVWRSAFVAAVFALHPLRVESVAWVAERKDVLSGLFFGLTLYAHSSYARQPSRGRYALVAVCLALGLMSKPMLVTVPIVLLLLDYWPLRRLNDVSAARKLLIEKIPLFAMSLVCAVIALRAQGQALESSEALPLSWRIANAFSATIAYLCQTFWPSDLAVFYPHPEGNFLLIQAIAAAGLLLLATIVVVIWRKRFPYLLLGWLWFLIMLLPVIGLVQVGLQAHADRYTYLPQIGILVALSWGIHELSLGWRQRRLVLAAAAAIIISALAWAASVQAGYWRGTEALWQRTLAVTKNNDVAHTNLAALFLEEQRTREALPHAQAAVALRPDSAEAHSNLGLAHFQLGDHERAASEWRRSLQLKPAGLNARTNLAWILATSPNERVRNGAEAVRVAEETTRMADSPDLRALRALAAAYAEAGRFSDAVRVAETGAAAAREQHQPETAVNFDFHLKNYRLNRRLRDAGKAEASLTPPASE